MLGQLKNETDRELLRQVEWERNYGAIRVLLRLPAEAEIGGAEDRGITPAT